MARRGAHNPEQLADISAASAPMLLDAQATIDEGLTLAALTIAEADGHEAVSDPGRRVAIARGMMRNAQLARYFYDSAWKEGKPSDAGRLRHMSGAYDDILGKEE